MTRRVPSFARNYTDVLSAASAVQREAESLGSDLEGGSRVGGVPFSVVASGSVSAVPWKTKKAETANGKDLAL